ncbi:MAG: hypothetical protein JXR37_19360 [Kiritimatiellae bacterium]|nr:hypothetical protein [Kiritimatiellia bacterium]
MATPQKIGDLVDIPPVRTVIRIEEGRTASEEIAASFVFTAEIARHIAVLADSLLKEHGQGFFLQGDFGAGKSHVLAALTAWAAGRPGAEALSASHAGLKRVQDTGRRLLPVDISLVRHRAHTALEQIVAERIEELLAEHGNATPLSPLMRFRRRFADLLRDAELAASFAAVAGVEPAALDDWLAANPRDAYLKGVPFLRKQGVQAVEALIEDRAELFATVMTEVRRAGFAGIVLLIDELSEFLRAKRSAAALNEDARLLQFLGELTQTEPLWIVGAVQESIERTGDLSPATLQKIKDRYPVKLALSTVHVQALIRGRLVKWKAGADSELQRLYELCRRQFPSFTWSFDAFQATYPVHPATIGLLDGLGDLFSVHRGIVDFVWARLAGDPKREIPGILDRPPLELLAPDSIYDHFAGRMAEFSDFYVYPRHIVPHLDEVAERVIEDADDRALARRLIRMLVLYQIHPTAEPPDVRRLAELAGCALSPQDPKLNAEFVAEAILDPIAEHSRFLVKRPPARKGEAPVYVIVTEDDPAKSLKARLQRAMADVAEDDSRLLTEPLAELPESASWPGKAAWAAPCERLVSWRLSSRRVLTAFLHPGSEQELRARLAGAIETGAADMAVVLAVGEPAFDCPHTAVWRIPLPAAGSEAANALREYRAAREVAAGLKPGHPAEAALIPAANDRARRSAAAAQQAALDAVYAGTFTAADLQMDDAARQLKRFDRLLETAAARVLERRFPRFVAIAPRNVTPFPRLYQRLLDDYVFAGSVTVRAAREQGLTDLIEGLALPLGLVTPQGGAYVFAPDPGAHPLLRHLFAQLKPSGATPLAAIRHELRTGDYGVPEDAVQFLLCALAIGGVITLLKGGRSLPLEFLSLASADTATEIAPGEVIAQGDRETLLRECAFLLPADAAPSFGLRRQREAWQAVTQFKRQAERLVADIRKGLSAVREYSAFAALDTDAADKRLAAIEIVHEGIKVSYQAREGLERFLQAWRGAGLTADDVARLKSLREFLVKRAEQVVFINHYVRHRAVDRLADSDEACRRLRDSVTAQLANLEQLVADGGETELDSSFAAFREHYMAAYDAQHADACRRDKPPALSKFARRAVTVLRRLAAMETLDRPPGLDEALRRLEPPARETCTRNLREELLRAPVCGCGFEPGTQPEAEPAPPADPEETVERLLAGYTAVLQEPAILEALDARAYVLQDAEPAAVKGLNRLARLLRSKDLSPAVLLDVLDSQTAAELDRALSGRVEVRKKGLHELFGQLAGRRLTAAQVLALTRKWIGELPDKTVLALEGDAAGTPRDARSGAAWWPLLHPDLFPELPTREPGLLARLRETEDQLEAAWPAAGLRERLQGLDNAGLASFIAHEPCHVRAAQAAWTLLAERVLRLDTWPADAPAQSRHPDPDRARVIARGLELLQSAAGALGAGYPARLRFRLDASELLAHPWISAELESALYRKLKTVAQGGEDWLRSLPALAPVNLDDRPVVVIFDGVSPDVWARTREELAHAGKPLQSAWRRTPAAATEAGIRALLGLDADPADALPARGIPYHHVRGNERAEWLDLIGPLEQETAVVVRVALLDQDAHRASGPRLHEMPAALARVFEHHLFPLADACAKEGRRLLAGTDHGLTLSRRGLDHGKGGVYEQAVWVAECSGPARTTTAEP